MEESVRSPSAELKQKMRIKSNQTNKSVIALNISGLKITQ